MENEFCWESTVEALEICQGQIKHYNALIDTIIGKVEGAGMALTPQETTLLNHYRYIVGAIEWEMERLRERQIGKLSEN